MAERIGLIGPAGAMGQSVADALVARGQSFRVIGRSAGALEASFKGRPGVECVSWNPEDPSSVRAAVCELYTLIYLVGVPYHQFEQHPVVMRQTLAGAIAEGVQRLALVGTVYPYGLPRTERVTEDHPREPHTFKGRVRPRSRRTCSSRRTPRGRDRGTILLLPDFYGPGIEKSLPP